MRIAWIAVGLVACAGDAVTPSIDAAPTTDGREVDGPVGPPPARGTYAETCDGSAVLAFSTSQMIVLSDEDQIARVYERGVDGPPIATRDLSGGLGVGAGAEVDLEDMTAIGSSVYMIASHGRNTSGALKPDRYRFAAFTASGNPPQLGANGHYDELLVDMLDSGRWTAPNAQVIAALDASSKLGTNTDPQLAPEVKGTNIEGLATFGADKVAVGFRNPLVGGKAIVIVVDNPAAVVGGARAQIGAALLLDLGGGAIRGMSNTPDGGVLVIAGPPGVGGPFSLYRWNGTDTTVALIGAIPVDVVGSPEAVLLESTGHHARVILDQGDSMIGGAPCKDAPAADRRFRDVIVPL